MPIFPCRLVFINESIGRKIVIWENFLNDIAFFSVRFDMDVKTISL